MEIIEILEKAPDYAEPIAELIRLSHDEQSYNKSTFALFLDIAGIPEEIQFDYEPQGGLPLYRGYYEMSILAGALEAYSTRPIDIQRWLMEVEIALDEKEEEDGEAA